MLAHMVYFSLKDKSPQARQKLVDACKKYLTDHPGLEHFSVGVPAEEYTRPVNDREFDVALHLIFTDHATHDAYQVAPRHNQFIDENKESWAKVRVFDTDIA
jgi:hypothetical protein